MFLWLIDLLESFFNGLVWILNFPYHLLGVLLLLLRPWTWLSSPPPISPAYVKNLTPEDPETPGYAPAKPVESTPAAEAAPAPQPPPEPEKPNPPCVLFDQDPAFWEKFFLDNKFGGTMFDVVASVTVEKKTGYKLSKLGEWEEVDNTFYFEKTTNKIALAPPVRFSFSIYYQLYLTTQFPESWLVECEKELLKIQADWKLLKDNTLNDSRNSTNKAPSSAKQKQERCAELMRQMRARVISRGWLHLLPIFEGTIYQRAWMTSPQGQAFEQPWGSYIHFGTLENGEELDYSGDMSILTIAHNGSGKTKSLILPNLATYTGGVMCLDVTGERYAHTAHHREAMEQKVWRFDPFGNDNAAAFNPLSVVRRTPFDMWGDAEKLAAVFAPTGGSNRVFWSDSIQELLAVLICYCILNADKSEHEATPSDLIAAINSDFRKMEWMLRSCTKSEEIWSLDTHAQNMLNLINTKGHFPTVPELLKTALKDWNNPQLLANTSRTDWTPAELLNGSASVFLTATPNKMATEGTIMRVFIGAHILALLAEQPKQRPESPLLFVFDDFLQLPPLNLLEPALLSDPAYGLRFWLVVSSMSALHQRYGRATDTIINMCKIKTFSNVKGQAAKALSKLLGDIKHPLFLTGRKPLVSAQELAGPEFEALHVVTIAGAPPAKVKKRFFDS